MKFLNWIKKNYLIVILFFITVLVLGIKLNIRIKNTNDNNEKEIIILPTPTIIKNIYGNKTIDEITKMDPETRYDFVTELSREEIEELDLLPNYDFTVFLPIEKERFVVEKFDVENRKITIKPLISDKTSLVNEINDWLFYETGNNPKKIEIIWSQ